MECRDVSGGEYLRVNGAAGNGARQGCQGLSGFPEGKDIPGGELLGELVAAVRRFVVLGEHESVAVALWVLHTHAVDAAESTPYLSITSAEKRSGKSLLLDLLAVLVANPWRAVQPSEAVVYRKIDRDGPTLLLDEVDTIWSKAGGPQYEGLRALLNAGHRRGVTVPRCEGPTSKLREFETFCCKALAGIGELPDTVADRSIRIRLRRKAPHEQAARYRRRDHEDELQVIHDKAALWGSSRATALLISRPSLPSSLSDRQADGWEPLLAIADDAAGGWPDRARAAAEVLSEVEVAESVGIRLLRDVRAVLGDRDRLTTGDLLDGLHDLEEAPWGDWYGKPLTARKLARLLLPYDVASRQVRTDDGRRQGYLAEDFADAWRRYTPATETLTSPDNPDMAPSAQGYGTATDAEEQVAEQLRAEGFE